MDDLINRIIRYFDLQSGRRTLIAEAQGAGKKAPAAVLPQYLALLLGITIEPYLHHYIEHAAWSVDIGTVIGRIVFGAVVGAMLFPSIYKSAFDPSKPVFVQLCAIFSAGIGWQSLIQGGGKLVGA